MDLRPISGGRHQFPGSLLATKSTAWPTVSIPAACSSLIAIP
jgi:hypothetical protein